MSLPLPAEDGTALQQGFVVESEHFSGTLGELAHALRSHALLPGQIDVYRLVREYLVYYQRVAQDNLDLATETLPPLARVIELKARMLLPRPPRADDDDEGETELEETLQALVLLEELEDAIRFLKQRRDERRIILPARAPRPDYPRPERPIRIGVTRLAEMASRHQLGSYFELAIERLTMASAMKSLLAALRQLRRATLTDLLPEPGWSTRVMSFAGMLELVKEGQVRARQERAYGPIELELTEAPEVQEVA